MLLAKMCTVACLSLQENQKHIKVKEVQKIIAWILQAPQ